MKRPLDLTIGQRLGIGFALLLLLLATLVGIVLSRNAASARAQEAFTTVVPVSDGLVALERAVLYTAIQLRSYLLEPDAERLVGYEASADLVRDAVTGLRAVEMDESARELFADLAPRIEEYLRTASLLVLERPTRSVPIDQKGIVSDIREDAVAAVRRFGALQEQNTRTALATMAAERWKASLAMMIASALAAVFVVIFAVATTQAIRRPAVDLLRVAAALEEGDWNPALAYAPGRDRRMGEANPRSELLRLRRAFGAAAASLQRREHRLRADGEIASATASSLHKETVARMALRGVIDYVDAQVGVIYEHEPAAGLRAIAHHGGGRIAAVPLGDGIPGQAAAENRMLVVRDIPADTPFRVRIGYDAAPPKSVAAVPIAFQDELLGVLLVASLRNFDQETLAFLQRSASQLAVGLHNVKAYAAGQQLLAEVRDSSERIQAQNEELQAQSEELQAQHEEIQAQNDELRHQGDELRAHTGLLAEADERKNEFLGVLGHELRNPLAAIASSVFTLQRAPAGSDRTQRAHAVIERQTRHLTRLIDDLLDITRVTHGKVRIVPEDLDLVELVRATVEDHRDAMDAKGLALDLSLPACTVPARADRIRMSQVIGNLLNNSTKFTNPGGRVEVAVDVDEQTGHAVLRITDTGIGLSASEVPHLFQPFRQEGSGVAPANGGLGLGLALVKGLVELHGGSVDVRSEGTGRGAEFVVRLPASSGSQSRSASVESAAAHHDPVSPGGQLRVLLVEDDLDVAGSLREALECDGHTVDLAGHGQEALERAAAQIPHVVLCDIGLPMMDGYEVARRFRADQRFQGVYLVALSGYAADADRARALEAGFDRHLAKPPDFNQLDALFGELLAQRSAAAR